MWQKCPNCNGTGLESNITEINEFVPCSVCKGNKIISKLTGLPPVNVQEFTKSNNGLVKLENLKNP